MTEDKIRELETKYPFVNDPNDPELSFAYGVCRGWLDEFEKMCAEIAAVLKEYNCPLSTFQFVQVKEKFGEMRVYWDLEFDFEHEDAATIYNKIDNIVDFHCAKTANICGVCGAPATVFSRGWVLPYCENCYHKISLT